MAVAEVPSRLLRTKQAAEYLSCSDWTLRKLVRDGKIPHVLLGEESGAWRFDVRDLEALIESHRQNGA